MKSETLLELKEFLATRPSESDLKVWMSRLPPEKYFECALYLLRQGPTTFIRVSNVEHAFKNPERLSDEELFEQLGQALDDTTTIVNGKIGVVNPRENAEPMSRFASLYNEAVRRGFQREDIGCGMSSFRGESSKLNDFAYPDWKRFEKLVARIHRALCRDAEVKWSEKLIDASGTARQIDVTIKTRTGQHEVLGIVQCKFEKRPVSITEVEAFVTVKGDLNAGTAIMVSRSGYQSGAEAKAKYHGIRLWTLQEAEHAAWREEIRAFLLTYPMFNEIRLFPPIPVTAFSGNGHDIDFRSVAISQGNQRTTLWNVVAQMIQDSAERCLPVPYWLDVPFPGATVSLLGKEFQLEKLEIHFDRYLDVHQAKQMKIPIGNTYSFKSSTGGGLTIAERDLPPLMPQ